MTSQYTHKSDLEIAAAELECSGRSQIFSMVAIKIFVTDRFFSFDMK